MSDLAQVASAVLERLKRIEDAVWRQGGTVPDVGIAERAQAPWDEQIREVQLPDAVTVGWKSQAVDTRGYGFQNASLVLTVQSIIDPNTGLPPVGGSVVFTHTLEGTIGGAWAPVATAPGVTSQLPLAASGGTIAFQTIRVDASLARSIRSVLTARFASQNGSQAVMNLKIDGYLVAGSIP